MSRRVPRVGVVLLGVGFVLLLLYLSLTAGPAPDTLASAEREAVGRACAAALELRLASARLPFPARTTELGGGRYRVEGMVDAPDGAEVVRRNYECAAGLDAAGTVRVDSVRLWQSH